MLKPRILSYVLFFLMLFIPVIAYYLVVNGMVKYSHIMYFKMLTYMVTFIYLTKKKIANRPGFLFYLVLYIFYLFIWAFFNGLIEQKGIISFLLNSSEIAALCVILIISNSYFSEIFIRTSIRIIKITVVVAVIVSIIQFFDQDFFSPRVFSENVNVLDVNIYQLRRLSIFGFADRNEIGLSFLPLLSVLTGYMLYKKDRNYVLFLLFGGMIAILSNGRHLMIGFVILTLQVAVVNKLKFVGVIKYALLSVIIFLVLYRGILFLGYDIDKWIDMRLFSEGSIKETTRYGAFKTFALFFPKNMYFGTGVHLTPEIEEASKAIGSSQIHVGYLSHLVSYGLAGSFLLFSFWFLLAWKLYKNARATNYWGSFFAFLIYFWVQFTLVNYSLFFYGLIFALIFDKYFYDKHLTKKLKNEVKQIP
ncbi:MAG: hypothetical protein JXC36_07445 [Candidatus Atribacteria bacterium]|nr:hypothetical protein [Candidatus Atribacteria bacterium]